jgi:hypothetical protein
MVNSRNSTRRMPQLHIDTAEIRNHVITAQTVACRDCGTCTAILAGDIALLVAEISRLHQALTRSRRRAANFEAAIRAAIGAQKDGDHDPIGYLRDDLTPDPGGAYGT